MTTLTAEQTLDMLGDLAAKRWAMSLAKRSCNGSICAGAVITTWRSTTAGGKSLARPRVGLVTKWRKPRSARSQAAERIKEALALWQGESRSDDQVAVLGMRQVPPHLKPRPADDCYVPGAICHATGGANAQL